MCHAIATYRMTPLTGSLPSSAADVLIEQLGLTRRTTAEVQDLYSRPAEPPVPPAVPQNDAPGTETTRRLHPQPLREPDLNAA
jgi:hypothetical protein